MYDPTIFENVKVAMENHLYDLDNLYERITIINRSDQMDFAILSRCLAIRFTLAGEQAVTAEVILEATLEDLAGEILEQKASEPGCFLRLQLKKQVTDVENQCAQIERLLLALWGDEVQVTQTISYGYKQENPIRINSIEVVFQSKLNESHMEDIPDFLDSVLIALKELQRL